MEQSWLNNAFEEAVLRLKGIIEIQSFSREEEDVAEYFEALFSQDKIAFKRKGNNLRAINLYADQAKPTLLFNSHIDTVKPNAAYTMDPFKALVKDEKLYGLGSNDAGASLICLYTVFKRFYAEKDLPYNLIFLASAEEEISGANGVESVIDELGDIDFAIVGEPTEMNLAVAEKGLMVLDCVAHGSGGHAARSEGVNAIYQAMDDISWFRSYRFEKVSELLGEVKMSVTMIESGTQHNVIPAQCKFTVDVRCNEMYSLEELLQTIKKHVNCDIIPRSLRLKPSSISTDHPIVKAGLKLGRSTYGSPTLSDQALMPFPSVKIGPGDSVRSHQADEFIYLHEIKQGIEIYYQLLNELFSK